MPQLSPMDWCMLMFYFLLIYMIFLVNIYFLIKIKFNLIKLNFKSLNFVIEWY